MASLAVTACSRCREQKLKCSRELPVCERCSRLHAICSYPAPPDRKALATSRAQAKTRRRRYSKSKGTSNGESFNSPSSTSPSHSIYPAGNDTAILETSANDAGIGLPLAVQKLLQEVYFTCMFNAPLIFHRPTFTRSFEEGRVPQHTLWAMYATSTIFLPTTSSIFHQNANLLRNLGDLRMLGRQWAIRAGQEALQNIDLPTFEAVQTCEMLTLYWFSSGESQRNRMFSGIALKAAYVLGLDAKDAHNALNEFKPTSDAIPEWLKGEMARRCFWAIWFTQCINADHGATRASYDDRIRNMALPIGEASFVGSRDEPPVTLSTVVDRCANGVDTSSSEPPRSTRPLSELIVLIYYWAKIRDFIDSRKRISTRDWLADLFDLEGQLVAWRSQLSPSLLYSKRNLYEQLIVSRQPVYVFIHALYHQCRLVLHSSLVPQFSGLGCHGSVPLEAMGVSARIALQSAQAISSLGADLLALDWDPMQSAPFTGYTMYCSASIHIAALGSKDAGLVMLSRTNLIPNLKILKSMKAFWANLEKLWLRIHVLYGAQKARLQSLHNQNMADSASLYSHPNDLDQFAAEVRDPGQLSEPLADSVLGYTLRRLRPTSNTDTDAIQELEAALDSDQLAQLIDEDPFGLQQNPPLPIAGLDGYSDTTSGAQENNRTTMHSTIPNSWDSLRFPQMHSSQGYAPDWWHFSLDNLQQPGLPYGDFFDLNTNL